MFAMKITSFIFLIFMIDLSQSTSNLEEIPTLSNNKASYPKKFNSIKKRPLKTNLDAFIDITEKFKYLPNEDLDFIKELHKQFQKYGGKIKIRIENINRTVAGKNGKRNIDGDVGYGYQHNGYERSSPKFMFYPYSQKDIPPDAPGYYLPQHKNGYTIQPSRSFKLKTESYIEQQQPGHAVEGHGGAQAYLPVDPHQQTHQQYQQPQVQVQQQQHVEEAPLIVLRIPGPSKYAMHLKSLLQQYLEIRAAQYLQVLSAMEQSGHHHYSGGQELSGNYPHYQQEYQEYPQHLQPQVPYVQVQPQQSGGHYQQEIAQQPPHIIYRMKTEYVPAAIEAPDNAYQQLYLINMPQQAAYLPAHSSATNLEADTNEHYSDEQASALPVSENYPRDTHTKVIFVHNSEHASSDFTPNYALPVQHQQSEAGVASTKATVNQHYQPNEYGFTSSPHQSTTHAASATPASPIHAASYDTYNSHQVNNVKTFTNRRHRKRTSPQQKKDARTSLKYHN